MQRGVWLSIDFGKAFDSTDHDLVSICMTEIGVPGLKVTAYWQFLQGNQLVSPTLHPGSGIKHREHLIPHVVLLAHSYTGVYT